MNRYGFLAIWCDMRQEDLEDYRNWLTREHIADRTTLPGFLGVRLFTAVDDETSHFILYATRDAGVFASPAYLDVLNHPSAWTRRIMPKFGPFDRASGEQLIKMGNGFGAFVAVSRLVTGNASNGRPDWKPALAQLSAIPDVVSVRVYEVERRTTDIASAEKSMRSGKEGDFRYLLCVEAISVEGARSAAGRLEGEIAGIAPGMKVRDTSVRRIIYGEAPHEMPTDG